MSIQQSVYNGIDRHHAIVIGGSMAGLLAARVLSNHFERVTIIERDRLFEDAEPSKELPQGQHVHTSLAARDNVHIIDACEVIKLYADDKRVTGIVLRYRTGGSHEEILFANLVVDASGRGSRAPQWLASLGYGHVEESSFKFDAGYAIRWRHYERMSRLPKGFIIMGDAVCSFNPDYGQDVSVAPLEAKSLDTCLRDQQNDMADFPLRFQKALARVVKTPWMLTTGEDFRYSQAEGKQSLLLNRFLNV